MTLGTAKGIIDAYTFPWSERTAKAKATWAATLAARHDDDPIKRTVTWRNAEWRDPDKFYNGWRHQRRTNNMKWIRWEDGLVRQHGPQWQQAALKTKWATTTHRL